MPTNDITVKELTFSEKVLDDLTKIEAECFLGEAWDRDMLKGAFCGKNSYVLFGVEQNGRVVADCVLIYASDYGEIATVGVLPEYRKRGIGEQLLKTLIAKAYSLSVKTLTLEVNTHNFAAVSLYEKFGFVVSGIRHNYYVNPIFDGNDAYIMTLEIAS